MPQPARVFLVDDHPLVREWLGTLINQQPDLRTCGDASTSAQALQLISERKPDVVVVDISLEGGSGLELIKDIKASHLAVAVVVLSMHDEALYAERALRAGARGYVMKREATRNALQAIRTVLAGKLYLSENMTRTMAEKFVGGQPDAARSPLAELSDRELEVFQLLGRGQSTRQIADSLHLSLKTVQAFCARIKEKLNIDNATELLRAAMQWHDRGRVP